MSRPRDLGILVDIGQGKRFVEIHRICLKQIVVYSHVISRMAKIVPSQFPPIRDETCGMVFACRSIVCAAMLFPALLAQAQTPCENGFAGIFPCNKVDLLSFLPKEEMGGGELNDIWGWTDPMTGAEYALVGTVNGTSFVDIGDPINPVYLGNLPTHAGVAIWRDIKVYQDHAYIVADNSGAHGLQVFDLTQLRSISNAPVVFAETSHLPAFDDAHNIIINEDSGFAYAVGSEVASGGLIMIDLSSPTNPVQTGAFSDDGYTHDAQCVIYSGPDTNHSGSEICFACNEDTVTIVDVTTKTNPVQLEREGYPGATYTHQGWLTEDQAYFVMNDEEDPGNTKTHVFDVSNLTNISYIGFHQQNHAARDHNLYIVSNLVYQANYQAGLRILELTDLSQANLTLVGHFDTYPDGDGFAFLGAWSCYPFFESGIVIVSSSEHGLFVLHPNLESAAHSNLAISVRDSEDPLHTTNRLTYVIGVTNEGPDNVAGIVVEANMPTGVVFNQIDQIDDADDTAGFAGGTKSGVAWSGTQGWVELDSTGLAAGSGSFTSRVIDAQQTVSWDTFSWIPFMPYGKPLTDGGLADAGYPFDPSAHTILGEKSFRARSQSHPEAGDIGHGRIGLTLLLHLDESPATNGTVISNSSGVPNHATLLAGDGGLNRSVTGLFHSAISLDGLDDYLVTATPVLSAVPLQPVTIFGWVRPSGDGTLWSQYESGETNRFAARFDAGALVVEKDDVAICSSVSPIPTGQWHHVAYRRESDGTSALFLNGKMEASAVDTNGFAAVPFRIGTRRPGLDPLPADVDECAVSISALSEAQIEAYYLRDVLDIRFQVRSCDDDLCAGESFLGPDGTSLTWFDERSNLQAGTPSVAQSVAPNNRYFQYRAEFSSKRTDVSPRLVHVEIAGDHYGLGAVVLSQGSAAGVDPLVLDFGTIPASGSAEATVAVTVPSTATGTLIQRSEIVYAEVADLQSEDDYDEEETVLADTDSDGLADFHDEDDDGDVMPDVWELQFGLNPTSSADALLNSDGDWANNRSEYIADTSPTDTNSVLSLSIQPQSNGIALIADTSTQRLYTMEWAEQPTNTHWIVLPGFGAIPGQGPGTIFLDGDLQPRRTYRLEVTLPE